ncbi:glycosyl transferase [Blastochloris viridis]|uniref:Glycosyl transferase n=1 Tax=Blastochloris viridis TaxID=1079 RepID=A0A182D0Q5_BLAVI|nr:glycosyl transferase [Blastochloris viridis]
MSAKFSSDIRGPRADDGAGLPVELLPLIDRLPLECLVAAAQRADLIAVGGDEVVIAAGLIDRDAYARRLAAWLGLPFAELADDGGDVGDGDLPPPRLEAVASGVGAVARTAAGLRIAIAPRGVMIRELVRLVHARASGTGNLVLTTPDRFEAYVTRRARPRLGDVAAFGLLRRAPDMSAATRRAQHYRPVAVAGGVAALAVLIAADIAAVAAHVALSLVFLGWIALRCLALFSPDLPRGPPPASERALPVYSILIPLYREAGMVAGLLRALDALDYPREKLDILIVIEPDDAETRSAVLAAGLPRHVRLVEAPAAGPRTKPKALNAALPLARGALLAIFDAEDRPEPDQLRKAAAAFAAGGPDLACVQARLAIENARDGWLTRLFAGEYAGQFDVLLPMLVAQRLPVPLGGTSNHFRLATLRRVGGWDAFNVTEDADLGIRLARFGWRTGLIASTTWEEAPSRLPAWLRQRTRWFKGWMQTYLVHMRQPRRLVGELGWLGFASFQLTVGGTVLSALVHPLFALLFVAQLAGGLRAQHGALELVLAGLTTATLVAGYVGSATLALAGLTRRGLIGIGWVFAFQPLYWLLLSAAAWRALWQLAVNPFGWEKTEHGFGRTSVRRPQRQRQK